MNEQMILKLLNKEKKMFGQVHPVSKYFVDHFSSMSLDLCDELYSLKEIHVGHKFLWTILGLIEFLLGSSNSRGG